MNVVPIYGIVVFVLGLVVWRRIRETIRPIQGSGIKILLPIIYLFPLISMYSYLPIHLEFREFSIALLIGVLLAVPLILTTNYEIRSDGQIYAQKNNTFYVALLAVLLIRIVLRQSFSGMDPGSIGLLFSSVALSYVALWRISSFVKFRKVKQLQVLDNARLSTNA